MKCQLIPGSWVSGATAPLVPLAILILGNGRHTQVWVAWLRNPSKFAGTLRWVRSETNSCQGIVHFSSWQRWPRLTWKERLSWEFR